MEVHWRSPGAASQDARCPVCGVAGPKAEVLEASSQFVPAPLTLLACPACGTRFYDDLAVHAYEEQEFELGLAERYYLEQGAALDWLVWMLYQVDRRPVRRYLEIGCGYGLSLDYAHRAFGWRVKGIDPSPIARLGGETLGIDVENRYLQAGERPAAEPYELVFCSEVIEHVPDPPAFVAMLKAQLADGGCLMLTTPNAQAIEPGAPMLQPILSVGKHLVLFTQASLEGLLRRAGFRHVVVQATRDTLRAFASDRDDLRGAGGHAIDQAEFERYLAARAADFPPAHPLALGYRYRLFKAMVNAGRYDEARARFEAEVPIVREAFGFDLEAAAADVARLAPGNVFELIAGMPMNATGWLFFRGMVAINAEPDRDLAGRYFDAAWRVGLALSHHFATFELADGELDDLTRLARLHAVFCVADRDRARGQAMLDRIGDLPPDLAGFAPRWVVSADEMADFRARFAARYPALPAPFTPPARATRWLDAWRAWLYRPRGPGQAG